MFLLWCLLKSIVNRKVVYGNIRILHVQYKHICTYTLFTLNLKYWLFIIINKAFLINKAFTIYVVIRVLCFIVWYIQSKFCLLNLTQLDLCFVQNMIWKTGCSLAPLLYLDLRPLHLSIRVLYLVYCSLPTSAQLQYDMCCLWRRHVELCGRAAALPRIPGDALLDAFGRQARGSRKLWKLGFWSRRRTPHICPPAGYTLHSTVYIIGYNSKV